MIYPWLEPAWQSVSRQPEILHHGLLLNGKPGIGKRAFAESLSQLLLCQHKHHGDGFCGECQNCRLFIAGTHPDFHVISTEEYVSHDGRDLLLAYADRYQDATARDKRANPSRVIPIDQVRQLISRFATSAHIASHKVVLILPADSMNIASANALLKLLEEPPENSTLILSTDTPGYLPATVRSRCMQVGLAAPDKQSSVQWLSDHIPMAQAESLVDLIDGGPLAVLDMHEADYLATHEQLLGSVASISDRRASGVEMASVLAKLEFRHSLMWLQRFTLDLIKWRSDAAMPHWQGQISLRLDRISLQSLFFLYDKIAFYRRIAREQLNEQLALEDLMLILQRVLR